MVGAGFAIVLGVVMVAFVLLVQIWNEDVSRRSDNDVNRNDG